MGAFISFLSNRSYLFPVFFLAFLSLPSPASAQDLRGPEPVATPQQQQTAPKGGARIQRLRAQQEAVAEPEAPKPEPAGAPDIEKRGDDLIVHSPGGEYTVPGFFTGVDPGMQRPLNVQLPGQGSCVLKIDSSGAINEMTCQ
ncbi:MAG: hypothetical protein ACAH83_17390 [Alphaproteobacteria bacterium]